jgi:hypothetical protein
VIPRLEEGETVVTLAKDHPDVDRRALEFAAYDARTRPRRGRPSEPRHDGTMRRTSRA